MACYSCLDSLWIFYGDPLLQEAHVSRLVSLLNGSPTCL
jgi:hypothetical protein